MKKNIVNGWIYCLSNKAMSNMYKIGYTEFLEKRISDLHKSGIPYPFHIEFAKKVVKPFEKEQKIHEILKKERITKNREFFKTELSDIQNLFELVDGLWYDANIDKTIGKYVCKYFNNKPYYGIVFNTTIFKNNKTNDYEKVCCIIYEDNDREDMYINEFHEFQCNSEKIPVEILEKLTNRHICIKEKKEKKEKEKKRK